MGCLNSTQKHISKHVPNEEINHKIVVWGAIQVGKSTIFRQIQHINNDENEKVELEDIKQVIRANCVSEMIIISNNIQKLFPKKYNDITKNKRCIDDFNYIQSIQRNVFDHNDFIDDKTIENIGKTINNMWNLQIVKETFNQRMKAKYSIIDNMDYFFDQILNIMNNKWIPTKQDLFKARKRTTGINEYIYKIKNIQYSLYDIHVRNHSRRNRRKMMYVFESISIFMFVIGLNDYSKCLFVDETQNALLDTFEFFEICCKSKMLTNVNVVVFLNKMDLFREHLRYTPLSFCFKDEYKGRNFKQIDNSLSLKIISKLLSVFLDDNYNFDIPLDVINIISIYFDIREEWLDLCVNDGVDFIKHKCLSIGENMNANIDVYNGCAIVPNQIEIMMNHIYQMTTTICNI